MASLVPNFPVPTASQPTAHTGVTSSTSSPYLNQTVSPENIASVAYLAGFRGNDVVTAVAIALAESGGPGAIAGRNVIQPGHPYATTGWGLWQITPGNSEPQFGIDYELLDPTNNAKAAFAKFQSGGWHQWTTYNGPTYLSMLPLAKAAYKNSGAYRGDVTDPNSLGSLLSDVQFSPSTALSWIGNATGINKIADLLGGLFQTGTWLTILKVLAGLILVGMGIYMLVKG